MRPNPKSAKQGPNVVHINTGSDRLRCSRRLSYNVLNVKCSQGQTSRRVTRCFDTNIFTGSDLKEGHQMFTLAFVWQLMRAYTLSLLAKLSTDGKPVTEAQIIEWANKKVEIIPSTSLEPRKVFI